MSRSIAAIQADLDAAYAKRSQLLRGGALSVSTPASGSTQFITLDQINAMIETLKSELAEAQQGLRGPAQASGFAVIQVIGADHV